MKKTITVDVTEEDIKNGVRQNGFMCPIACALKRHKQDEYDPIWAGALHLRIGKFKGETPDDAFYFIDNFDKGLPVTPFSFTLEVEEDA